MSSEPDLQELAQRKRPSLLGDLVRLLRERRKWWLLPLVSLLLLFGLMLMFASGAAGPFVYTLF